MSLNADPVWSVYAHWVPIQHAFAGPLGRVLWDQREDSRPSLVHFDCMSRSILFAVDTSLYWCIYSIVYSVKYFSSRVWRRSARFPRPARLASRSLRLFGTLIELFHYTLLVRVYHYSRIVCNIQYIRRECTSLCPQIEATTFQYTLVGRGWSRGVNWPAEEHDERPERELRVELRAPDPGYAGTAIALVEAATRLLECRDRMPAYATLLVLIGFLPVRFVN